MINFLRDWGLRLPAALFLTAGWTLMAAPAFTDDAPPPAPPTEAPPTVASIPGPESYGDLKGPFTTDYKPVTPPPSAAWKSARYAMLTSELSPAVLYLNHTHEQHLFGKLSQWGLGAPTSFAFLNEGPTLQAHSAPSVELPTPRLAEPWILVWFHGAKGWTDWDSPWLVVLQHRPSRILKDEDGLHLTFPGDAGITAAMPLFGYGKSPQRWADLTPEARQASQPVANTEAWVGDLPTQIILRARWWTRALRAYPLHSRETFSVDRGKDRLTIRETMEWLPIPDDWKTPAIKFAPISPTLALAAGDPRFPLTFSAPTFDPDLMTTYGPDMGIIGKDQFDIRLDVLSYLHETEAQQVPDLAAHPAAQPALALLRQAMADKFANAEGKWSVDFGEENFCWAAMSDRYYPQGIAFADPALQANARKSLHNYFANWALKEERFRPFKGMLLLAGPGIGTWGGYDDAGKFSSNLLLTVWNYAQYTGDWDLVKERWPLLKRLFITPLESDWKTFGRAAIAEMGDEAAPAMAMARMAYRIGDADTYAWAAYLFARELLHEFVKQDGAKYFQKRQPYHTMEAMPEAVYLTNLWGDTAGWQIDGPTFPATTGERQFNNRWVRFGDPDIARFHRDHLADETKRELDGYAATGKSPYKTDHDDGHIAPSLQRLRSLLLNEAPEELAKLNPVDKIVAQPDSGKVAVALAFLRTAAPAKTVRLIPRGKATPFVLGLERQVEGGFSGLVQNPVWEVRPKTGEPETFWPTPVWHFWKPPASPEATPVGDRWPFGESRPDGPARPRSGKTLRLNWNTQVTTFEF